MQNTFRNIPIAIQLSEGDKLPQKIQVIRTGTFHHPDYGKFEITKEHLLSFKKNFDARVRGVDIALDFSHRAEGEAAAWFKEIELSDDGSQLWAVTEWTSSGAEAISGKKYRYVSADFHFDYQDNESLKKFGPTLLGAGLTNRPVVKNQAAVIELTEGKGDSMDPKDKKIADLEAELAELKKAGAPAPELDAVKKELEENKKKLSEVQGENKKLSEELNKTEAQKKEEAKKSSFDKQLSEGKVVEAQRKPFMENDMDGFLAAAQPVKLADKGNGNEPNTNTDDKDKKSAEDQVLELAEKKIADKEATEMGAAISMVLSENAELRKKYEGQ